MTLFPARCSAMVTPRDVGFRARAATSPINHVIGRTITFMAPAERIAIGARMALDLVLIMDHLFDPRRR
jgi:hypothetical protein